MVKHFVTVLGCLGFAMAIAAGCGSDKKKTPDEGSIAKNCRVVCEKTQECVTPNLDVPKCRRDCEDKSTSDSAHQSDVNECAACVEPRTCSQAADCAGDCLKSLVTADADDAT